jgi:hypothetical protein
MAIKKIFLPAVSLLTKSSNLQFSYLKMKGLNIGKSLLMVLKEQKMNLKNLELP